MITIRFSSLNDGSNLLTGFSQFWLRYVYGFSPHFHCQKSLRGWNDNRFHKGMDLDVTFEIFDPIEYFSIFKRKYKHIYLCGVTSSKYPGLHLALAPEEGKVAKDETYNGLRIEVIGARQLVIPYLPDGFAGMSRSYTTCRNWQFGVEYYGLDNLRRELVKE